MYLTLCCLFFISSFLQSNPSPSLSHSSVPTTNQPDHNCVRAADHTIRFVFISLFIVSFRSLRPLFRSFFLVFFLPPTTLPSSTNTHPRPPARTLPPSYCTRQTNQSASSPQLTILFSPSILILKRNILKEKWLRVRLPCPDPGSPTSERQTPRLPSRPVQITAFHPLFSTIVTISTIATTIPRL